MMKKENPSRRESTEVSLSTEFRTTEQLVVDNLFELSTVLLLIYVLIGGLR